MTVNTDWFSFEDQRCRTKQSETSTRVFVGKITVTTYMCRYDPVSVDLITGPLESVSRGPVPFRSPVV